MSKSVKPAQYQNFQLPPCNWHGEKVHNRKKQSLGRAALVNIEAGVIISIVGLIAFVDLSMAQKPRAAIPKSHQAKCCQLKTFLITVFDMDSMIATLCKHGKGTS